MLKSLVLRVFSSPPSSPFFVTKCSFASTCWLGRGASASFPRSDRERGSPVVAVDPPEARVSSPSTLTAVTLRRHGDGSSAVGWTLRGTLRRTTRLRCSTSRTPLARRSSSHAHRLTPPPVPRSTAVYAQRGAADGRLSALRAQYRPVRWAVSATLDHSTRASRSPWPPSNLRTDCRGHVTRRRAAREGKALLLARHTL